MKIALLLSATALTVMTAVPAFAVSEMNRDYSYRPKAQSQKIYKSDGDSVRDVKRGLNRADAKMRSVADDIHAFFIDDKPPARAETAATWKTSAMRRDMMAAGMIDRKVTTPQGREVAEVEDIILSPDGRASKVILSDEGMLGIGGKVAAFDYGRVITQGKDGRIVMSVSQDMIDRAPEFSYDEDDYMKANVIPAGSVSVDELLDGDVYDHQGRKVASVENLSIVKGRADLLVIGLDRKLAALTYSSLKITQDSDHDIRIDLTETQSRQLKQLRDQLAAR